MLKGVINNYSKFCEDIFALIFLCLNQQNRQIQT